MRKKNLSYQFKINNLPSTEFGLHRAVMRPRTFSQMQIAISNLTFVSYHPRRKFDAQDDVGVRPKYNRSAERSVRKEISPSSQ